MPIESLKKISNCKYNILEIQSSRINEIDQDILSLIQNRIIDRVVIKGFMSLEKRLAILNNLQNIPNERKFETYGCGGFLFL